IIYNLLGEEVAQLVDGFQQAGEYRLSWNASNVSSGIYFYRLSAGNYTETKKMVLLK
ncbi:MAG: T9SS type A sorting domain-containing protein, partial [Candidatus Marinimicrobia bacterium]|nr:T9SS type A sorting domain-containing protein [Candidatus Neomarinimicrobiota bacterium]